MLLLSGAASDAQSLGAAGVTTSACGHSGVAETPSPGLTCPVLGCVIWRGPGAWLEHQGIAESTHALDSVRPGFVFSYASH